MTRAVGAMAAATAVALAAGGWAVMAWRGGRDVPAVVGAGPPPQPPAAAPASRPTATTSNVDDADYVGPDACAGCHADNAAAWRAGLHRTMTQDLATATVAGDFTGAELRYGGGVARFTTRAGAPVMVLTNRRGATRQFRVTRTIGSRGLQEYVGVAEGDTREVRLPFGWWLARPGWYPQPYFDSWFDAEYAVATAADGAPADPAPRFDAFAAPTEAWADRCAWCHTTYPLAVRMARAGIGHGPERYLAPIAPPVVANHLPLERLVTVGISCESCHLGGRAHAAAPEEIAPSFVPTGAAVVRLADAPTTSDRHDPRVLGAVCGQCHATPSPRFPDGSAARNSSEALAMAAGACASAIRCVDCHDPHERGPAPGGPDRPAHLAACTACHPALAAPAAAAAHSHHPAGVTTCLDCHMPRLVQGIGTYVRSHRISTPADASMLASGAPNACNLCHLDRSIRWTTDALAAWGVRVAPTPAWRPAYGGDLAFAVGPAWLASPQPFVRMTAAAAYARRGWLADLPRLVAVLDDPRANTRMWMVLALEAMLGRRLTPAQYDPLAPPAERARRRAQLEAWAARAVVGTPAATASARRAR
ncbi:MAG: hypothetical protein R3B06_05345 [Kofleriaceae bacterium]